MSWQIFRKQLFITDDQNVYLPSGSTILSAALARTREDQIDIWYSVMVDAHDDSEQWCVHVAGTGHLIPEYVTTNQFVDTCVMKSGLVFHAFAWVSS